MRLVKVGRKTIWLAKRIHKNDNISTSSSNEYMITEGDPEHLWPINECIKSAWFAITDHRSASSTVCRLSKHIGDDMKLVNS